MRHTFLHRHRHARSRGARRRLARRLVARVQGVWRDPDRGQLAAAAALCAHSSVSPSAYSSAYRWSRVSRRNHEPRRRLCGKRRSPARRRSAPSARRSRTARRAPSPGDTLTGAAAEAVRESAPSCLASSRKRVRMLRTAPKRGSARAVNDTISGQKRRTWRGRRGAGRGLERPLEERRRAGWAACHVCVREYACWCVCSRASVRACERAGVRACVRACVCACHVSAGSGTHVARCELEEPLRGEARQQPHQAGGAGEEEDGGGRPPRRRRLRLRPD